MLMVIVERMSASYLRFNTEAKHCRTGVEMNNRSFESVWYQIQQSTGISKVSPSFMHYLPPN